jgi:hypothetical protein
MSLHLNVAVVMNHAAMSGCRGSSSAAGTVASKIDFSCTCRCSISTGACGRSVCPRTLGGRTWKDKRKNVRAPLKSA